MESTDWLSIGRVCWEILKGSLLLVMVPSVIVVVFWRLAPRTTERCVERIGRLWGS